MFMFSLTKKQAARPNTRCACVNECGHSNRSLSLESDFDLAKSIRLAVGREDVQFDRIILK